MSESETTIKSDEGRAKLGKGQFHFGLEFLALKVLNNNVVLIGISVVCFYGVFQNLSFAEHIKILPCKTTKQQILISRLQHGS